MRLCLWTAVAVLLSLSGPAVCFAAEPTRPNIVFLLADDLGYGDLKCYGHPFAKTPNLDRLAEQGTRFTQFYATGVTCCPSRTGLMTGMFPATFQKYPADHGFGSRVTVTELLKKAGYATGHFGKWHIGLYNIDSDPAEKENLAAKNPEVVARLKAKLTAWNATLPKEYSKSDDKD